MLESTKGGHDLDTKYENTYLGKNYISTKISTWDVM